MTVARITWHVTNGCSRYVMVWREGDQWPRYEHLMDERTRNWLRFWCYEPRIRVDRAGNPIVFFADRLGEKAGYVWNCETGRAGWIEEPDWVWPSSAVPALNVVPFKRDWMPHQ